MSVVVIAEIGRLDRHIGNCGVKADDCTSKSDWIFKAKAEYGSQEEINENVAGGCATPEAVTGEELLRIHVLSPI
jgi:hypothetical protein